MNQREVIRRVRVAWYYHADMSLWEFISEAAGKNNPVLGIRDPFFVEDDALVEKVETFDRPIVVDPTKEDLQRSLMRVIEHEWAGRPQQRFGQFVYNYTWRMAG